MRPQQYKSTVRKINTLTNSISEFELELQDEQLITFLPGQFVSVQLGEDAFRSYSISSNSSENKFITLLIDISQKGIGPTYFANLKIGDTVNFIGPSGKFYLPENIEGDIVFICTGAGFAPFESMLTYLNESKYQSKISLLFGVRHNGDKFKQNYLAKLESTLLEFGYKYCLSKDTPTDSNDLAGRVTNNIPVQNNSTYILCGNPNMITETVDILSNKGISQDKILYEKFTTTGAS